MPSWLQVRLLSTKLFLKGRLILFPSVSSIIARTSAFSFFFEFLFLFLRRACDRVLLCSRDVFCAVLHTRSGATVVFGPSLGLRGAHSVDVVAAAEGMRQERRNVHRWLLSGKQTARLKS